MFHTVDHSSFLISVSFLLLTFEEEKASLCAFILFVLTVMRCRKVDGEVQHCRNELHVQHKYKAFALVDSSSSLPNPARCHVTHSQAQHPPPPFIPFIPSFHIHHVLPICVYPSFPSPASHMSLIFFFLPFSSSFPVMLSRSLFGMCSFISA